jgi:hypothetical protein
VLSSGTYNEQCSIAALPYDQIVGMSIGTHDRLHRLYLNKELQMTTEERIASLELRLRRQRLGMIGMGVAFAGALFLGMAQQTSKDLVLDSLVIMKDGKPRVVMGTNKDDGGVGIAMLDPNGVPQLAISVDEQGDGGLVIMKDGKPRIAMGVGKDEGSVGITMLDHKGVARLATGTDAKGDGGMVIMDDGESPRIVMGSGPQGTGIMLIGAGMTEVPMPPK